MNLQEYNQRMRALIDEIVELSEQQEAIQKKADEIEVVAKALHFEYITSGDIL